MPITLTDAQRAALSANQVAVRALLDLHLDSGRYSFWDGPEHWAFDGTTYYAAGDFGEISSISMGQDLGAEGIEVRLNGTRMLASSSVAFDPIDLFGSIERETYHLRPLNVSFAFFDTTTWAPMFTLRRFTGLIDQIRQTEEIEDSSSAQLPEAVLVIAAESVARRYGERSGRVRSHEDQSEIHPGDEFFKYTNPTVGRQGSLWWGRKPPQSSTPRPSNPLPLIPGFRTL